MRASSDLLARTLDIGDQIGHALLTAGRCQVRVLKQGGGGGALFGIHGEAGAVEGHEVGAVLGLLLKLRRALKTNREIISKL